MRLRVFETASKALASAKYGMLKEERQKYMIRKLIGIREKSESAADGSPCFHLPLISGTECSSLNKTIITQITHKE